MAFLSRGNISLQNISNIHSIHWYCLNCWFSSYRCMSFLHRYFYRDGYFSCKAVRNIDYYNIYKMFRSSSNLYSSRSLSSTPAHIWTPFCQSFYKPLMTTNLHVPLNYMSTSSCNKDNFQQDSDSSTDDSETEKKDFKSLLENDPELRSILNDIMKDFEGPPPPSPGTAGKLPCDKQHIEDGKAAPAEEIATKHEKTDDSKSVMPWSVKDKFQEYSDSDATLILGAEEEQFDLNELDESGEEEPQFYLYQEKAKIDPGLQLERGETGVFDLPELIDVLKRENLQDIAVIEVPENLNYANYLVITTAKAPRHSRGVSEFIRKLYKMKKHKRDPYPTIEGADCHDWKVIDMGNIVLHVFLAEARSHYQIETLWTVGEEYDDLVNQKLDPAFDLLQQHMQFVKNVQVVESDQQIAKLGT